MLKVAQGPKRIAAMRVVEAADASIKKARKRASVLLKHATQHRHESPEAHKAWAKHAQAVSDVAASVARKEAAVVAFKATPFEE